MQEVILRHREEFMQVLDGYQPSERAKQILASMPLVILQGISGSGRNAIIDYMIAHMPYHQVVSDTTRPPKVRNGQMEVDGVAYYFRSEEDVLDDLRNGMFLEAELIHNQQISGISIRELERASSSGKTPINEVAREGVGNILAAKPDTSVFFVVPPSYEEWTRRLSSREQISQEELTNRTHSAILELQQALAADHFAFVVNHTLEQAARDIDQTLKEGTNPTRQQEGRRITQAILTRLQS
jgi:guanylate kinase